MRLVSTLRNASFALILLLVSLPITALTNPAYTTPDVRQFTLPHFDVEVTYPSSVKPGDVVTISISSVSKSSGYVRDLAVEILAPSMNGDMRSLLTISLVKDANMYSGNRYSRTAIITIATDVPRSFLMATVSQNVREYYSYYYYPFPYYRSWYNTSYHGYWWPMYCTYGVYTDSISVGMAPLSHALAVTPEYTQLKGEYERLQSDYDRLSADYSTLNTHFSKL